MAVYAIGDVQGCRVELERLLEKTGFDPAEDRLCFVGDLVNRGPDSLGVLRLLAQLGDACTSVLGNHDLHCMAVALGVRTQRSGDTLEALLEAPDAEDLLAMMQRWPLVHCERVHEQSFVLVHAGIPPTARVSKLMADNQVLCSLLQECPKQFCRSLFNSDSLLNKQQKKLVDWLTRIRMMDARGRQSNYSGPPEAAPQGLKPWYEAPIRVLDEGYQVVFGHWAALQGRALGSGLHALDTGCVWGGALTSLRLDDGRRYQVAAK